MTTWHTTRSCLSIQDDTVCLELDGGTCIGDDFLTGTLNDAVLRTFDLMTLVEARALSPLPCFCGTGWRRFHEHDALLNLARCQHPRAPIDHKAMTARCRICGRWWTLEEMGDSHYSYHYSVRQFEPGG